MQELKEAVETVPELRSVLKEDTCKALIMLGTCKVERNEAKQALKQAYTTLMTLPNDVVASTVTELVNRLAKEKQACFFFPFWSFEIIVLYLRSLPTIFFFFSIVVVIFFYVFLGKVSVGEE